MRTNFFVFFLIMGLAAAAVAADAPAAPHQAVVNAAGVQQVEIKGGEYYFAPQHIVVRVGVPVEFVLRKTGGFIPHNIVMDEPAAGMKFTLDFGKDGDAVRFTPTRTGVYPFYCDKKLLFFKGHRERGMEGKIEVTD